MASAFVSYAHEDQEFVLALVQRLRAEGLAIRYDQVALRVGDSLIETIAREIADGDFLIAVVSPASVESAWCQRELSLAATQGINQKQIKVLPVRFKGAPIPDILGDIFYADADLFPVETVSEMLATSMQRTWRVGRTRQTRRQKQSNTPGDGLPMPKLRTTSRSRVLTRSPTEHGTFLQPGRVSGEEAISVIFPIRSGVSDGRSTNSRLG